MSRTSNRGSRQARPSFVEPVGAPDPVEAPEWLGDATAGVDAWLASARDADVVRGHAAAPPPEDSETTVPDADPESFARKILLDQLTGRARSRHELAEKLAKKNVPAEVATKLLDRFEEVGLIDDSAFARQWIESRGSQGRGLAGRALAQELRRKGIDDEVAREALQDIDSEDEQGAAQELIRRKLRSMNALDDQVKTRRLVGMLARKGYPPGLAFAVVRLEVGAHDDFVVD